jgi:hypothetical protein
MSVGYTIIRTDGSEFRGEFKDETKYEPLAKFIRLVLGVDEIERVRVLHDGKRTDMFCDEMGLVRAGPPKPMNRKASEIYQAAAKSQGMRNDHMIPGDCILFDRPVWDDVE